MTTLADAPATVPAPAPPEAAPVTPAKTDGFRRDIQGLRGFAVLLVVVEHVVGKPQGAFVGLEFFFVISGYLITGLLLREADKSGSVSIKGFYQRRVRRIFPAAMVALAATVIVARLLSTQGRYESIREDAWYTLGFWANWHFISDGTDYFNQAASEVSPLRHYWSLSVEEQWYVVWPLVVLAVAALTRRRIRRDVADADETTAARVLSRVAVRVGWVAAVLMVASFVWACWQTSTDPRSAYFSTFTRAWEIAVGALLACVAARLLPMPTWVRTVGGGLGVVGIVVSALVLDSDRGFPGPTGALPVLSAALVIAVGTGVRSVPTTSVFNLGFFQYFGKTSYSLYLVHWPILIYCRQLLPDDSLRYYVWITALMIVCTLLLHHLVEMPVLKSRFLLSRRPAAAEGPGTRLSRKRRSTPRRTPQWAHAHNAIVAVLGAGLIAALLVVGRFGATPQASTDSIERTITQARNVVDFRGKDKLAGALRYSLRQTDFPAKLAPTLGDVEAGMAPQMLESSQCLNPDDVTDVDNCVYGAADPTKTAVVFGDSVSQSYMPGLIDALGPEGYQLHGISFGNCPSADVEVTLTFDPAAAVRCNAMHQPVYDQVDRLDPDLVIISSSSAGIQRLASGNREDAAREEWLVGMKRAIEAVSAPGREVIVLAPNPIGPDPADCVSRFTGPGSCLTHQQKFWYSQRNAEQAAARQTGARYINTSTFYCVEGKCPIFALGLSMRWDGSHITAAYSRMLAGRLGRAILDPDQGRTARTDLAGQSR